jgi:UPF0755 protein
MTFDPVTEQPAWLRLARVAFSIAMIVLAGFIVIGGASYLGRWVHNSLGPNEVGSTPVNVQPGIPVTVDIPTGATGQDIGVILTSNGVVRTALEFELAVQKVDAAQRLRAGTYSMVTLMDPDEVVAMLVSGPAPSVYRLTIIEGLRIEEILTALAERTPHTYVAFEEVLLNGDVSTSLVDLPETPALTDWEGLLFPDTYEFTRTASPASILQRMATTMEQRVNSIDWTAWEELGYTRYQGIVAASLIESEVRVAEERPIVSSVIHNRLEIGMRLELDATVLYALRIRDIAGFDREFQSPYNTYQVEGLPPTPISAPGRASLVAVAEPAETPYFFYVLTDLDGRHAFAVTFAEHQANIAQSRRNGVLP